MSAKIQIAHGDYEGAQVVLYVDYSDTDKPAGVYTLEKLYPSEEDISNIIPAPPWEKVKSYYNVLIKDRRIDGSEFGS